MYIHPQRNLKVQSPEEEKLNRFLGLMYVDRLAHVLYFGTGGNGKVQKEIRCLIEKYVAIELEHLKRMWVHTAREVFADLCRYTYPANMYEIRRP